MDVKIEFWRKHLFSSEPPDPRDVLGYCMRSLRGGESWLRARKRWGEIGYTSPFELEKGGDTPISYSQMIKSGSLKEETEKKKNKMMIEDLCPRNILIK